ncbi:YceD family protein [Stenotrophobium rhamnosiphilum]|uniref:Large ribosomal RNA subunit accumulation protein YceD n=1 Tax=Stenotrophobium rhamnosiphilum TaxID=2029166 RepID=A0A2T5MKV5_9GAMM|nr:YceD family protein [Stenotrophobium rhamnosiphilum]PTU33207.1 hypothetical protein CJD38_03650 [Stenotrophobium rhamnosiphilum]
MPIPQKIRVSTAVNRREHYVGELALSTLPKLSGLLADDASVMQVDLLACKIIGLPALTGVVEGPLKLECSRCNKPYQLGLRHELDLRLVSSEEEEQRLMQDCEPYWVQDDELALRDLLEDELLLALPMLPRCDSCENIVNGIGAGATESAAPKQEPRRENPFAALKKFKL